MTNGFNPLTFAQEVKPLSISGREGVKLLICGKEYDAWDYDTYIYDAIEIAKKWKQDEVSFMRIWKLREWLRENVQHGHDLPYENLNSLDGTRKFIETLIQMEYRHNEDGEELIEDQLASIKEIFGDPRNEKIS
jgi:hypothetical protein